MGRILVSLLCTGICAAIAQNSSAPSLVASSATSFDFRPSFSAGDKPRFEMFFSATATATAQSEPAKIAAYYDLRATVQKGVAKPLAMLVTIDRLRTSINDGGRMKMFDTSDPASAKDPLADLLRDFELKSDMDDGWMISVPVPEAWQNAHMRDMAEDVAWMANSFVFYLPDEPVSLHDKWKAKREYFLACLGGRVKETATVEFVDLRKVGKAGRIELAILEFRSVATRLDDKDVKFGIGGLVGFDPSSNQPRMFACQGESATTKPVGKGISSISFSFRGICTSTPTSKPLTATASK